MTKVIIYLKERPTGFKVVSQSFFKTKAKAEEFVRLYNRHTDDNSSYIAKMVPNDNS